MSVGQNAGQQPARISVVVIAHNNEQHVAQCLDSLLGQTLQPFEIIVCNDASTDGTRAILEDYASRFPAIVRLVTHQVNIGIPANLNSGFRVARGDYISLIAGDDIWLPEKLEREYLRLQETGAAWVYSKVVLYWDDLARPTRTQAFWGTEPGFEGDIFEQVLRREMSLRNYLLRRDAMESLGFFDECVGMYEDWDFNIRMSSRYPIAHVCDANVVYLIHGGGEHHAPMYRHMAEVNKVLRKNAALIPDSMGDVGRATIRRFWPENSMSTARDKATYRMALDSLDLPYMPAQISADGEGLIFLVSLPRSGSTMLQRVLGSHPDIHTEAEPWLMLNPLYALKHEGVSAEYDAGTCRQALAEFLEQLPGGEENYYDSVRQMSKVLYSRAVRFSGKTRFLDKTPRYFYILPELVRTFPRAKVVVLLRNPLAVLASVLETWFQNNTTAFENSTHCRDMLAGPAMLAQSIRQLGDRICVTRYEDIVAESGSEIDRICKYLGIPTYHPMLKYGENPAPEGGLGDSTNVNGHTAPVDEYVEKWRATFRDNGLEPYALSYLEHLGEEVLQCLGYPGDAFEKQLRSTAFPQACAKPPVHARTPASLNREGERAFEAGDIGKASELFYQAHRLDPGDVISCNNIVVLHWQAGEVDTALKYLLKALKLDPLNRDVIINGGRILDALDKKDDARNLYNAYLEQNPGDMEISRLLFGLDGTPSSDGLDPGLCEGNESLAENVPAAMVVGTAMSTGIAVTGAYRGGHDSGQGNDILVTAIVSTYNSERFIRGCLEDLEAQTIADRLEIIVVDSGSEQREGEIVREFQQRYSNIRYLRTGQRETIYAAWNRAIAQARGKYLSSANTDDRHVPRAYERMVSELEANPDVALVYADSALTRVENASIEDAPVEAWFRWPGFDPRHLFAVCYIGPQPMWRRSLHEKYGSFDAEMEVAGDYDFWLRMAATEMFRHIPEVLGLYLASANSIEHASAGAGAAESEQARERNWPAEWGERPQLCPGYLVPVEHDITGALDDPGQETPHISIIMPTKDRLHLLGRALDSVLAQGYRNWELIVVNDGGESIRHLVEERAHSGRIRCIEFGWSRGQAAARNTALAEARGELVCYLDDDDCYLPHHLQTVVNEMAGAGESFIYTDAVVVKETVADGSVQEVGRSNPYRHDDYSRERLLVNNYIPINTWAHRRSCLDQVGLFDDSLSCYEDWEFLLRLADRYGFRHVGKTTVEVRHRTDQVDNVSRRRLSDTVQAYRDIYARHAKQLTEDLRAQREKMLEQLTSNIDAWTATDGHIDAQSAVPGVGGKDSYSAWMERHDLNDRDMVRYATRMETAWTLQPSVHLVMTHVAGQEAAVADTLDSLASQLYGGWGLSIVSGEPCPDPVFAELDNLEWHQVDGALMDGVNEVLAASGAEWLGLLEAGVVLEPHWLYRHVDHLHRHPEWRLVYMDEDRVDPDGRRYDPLFKPDCNLELLRAMPYMGNTVLIERAMLLAAGGWGQQNGAEVYDTVLRVIECCGEQGVGHIPDVLVHRQDRYQLALDQELIAANRRSCVAGHLERCGIEAEVRPGTLFGSCFVDYACADRPPVDIIVPVSGKPDMLELFLDKLWSRTAYPDFRVRLLLKDDIELPATATGGERIEVVRCSSSVDHWQAVLELARASQAEHVLLMSPGAIAIQPDWLGRLVALLDRPGVAVVAPRLVSSEQKVVGGGIVTGAGSYAVGMGAFGGLSLDESGYMGRAQVAQELSAVSNSCMLVRKSVLTSAGDSPLSLRLGFYQAVDFCLRVRAAGGKILWTPHSTLMFAGEAPSGLDGLDLDQLALSESGQLCRQSLPILAHDPAYSPNLALTGERFTTDDRFVPGWKPDDRSAARIIGFAAGSIGSWKFRIQQPLEVLHREQRANSLVLPFNKELVPWPSMAELERLQPDTLLMHNTMHDAYMDSMEAYKKINSAFIVFGQDDLIFALPPKNPFSKTGYRDVKKRLRRCLGIADRLIVTTEPLADELRGMTDDVRVVPNYLDETVWGGLESRRATSAKPRIGWAGAQQHLGDLELLEEVVRETAQEVDWVFFGMCPDFLHPYVKEIHNPVTFGKYPQKLATLNLDLALAPLEHNRFNQSKSNLRILEYGALGWPVIATDIAPYREAPVCRVPNQPRAWIKAVRERIHDMDATRREGDALRAWVRAEWMLQQHLQEWLAALDPADVLGARQAGRQRAATL